MPTTAPADAGPAEAGPSPAAVAAALRAAARPAVAPEPGSVSLRRAVAGRYRLPVHNVLVGPGAASLLQGIIARAAAGSPGGEVIYSWPSFEVYATATAAWGLTARPVDLAPGWRHDLDALAAAITGRTRLILLDSPHNISGTAIDIDGIINLAGQLPAGAVLVLDNVHGEYQDRAPDPAFPRLVAGDLPVIVCRSFSKAHHLFGLRVGYLLGHPDLLARAGPRVLRYDLSSVAQAAAAASIADVATLAANRRLCQTARGQFAAAVEAVGLTHVPSQSAAVLVRTGDRTPALAQALELAGCTVRIPGPPPTQHLQFTIPDPAAAALATDALQALTTLNGGTLWPV